MQICTLLEAVLLAEGTQKPEKVLTEDWLYVSIRVFCYHHYYYYITTLKFESMVNALVVWNALVRK